MSEPAPSVRVVVKLPYPRPENAPPDPPKIDWTPEKADILWKVIERSRSLGGGTAGADWKALAAHLEVPLPYLLYRVNARFQDEIRGLKDIQGVLSPTASQPARNVDFPTTENVQATPNSRTSGARNGVTLSLRAQLSSLGSSSIRPRKATSSSTLTLQPRRKSFTALSPTAPSSDDDEDEETTDSDDNSSKEEEVERKEEEEALAQKLAELQRMMTNETLGLVSGTRPRLDGNNKGKAPDRGRHGAFSPARSVTSSRLGDLSSRSASVSHSISSASSPQGSIPDIPSPSSESQPHSPTGSGRRNVYHKSSSSAALNSGNAYGRRHQRYATVKGGGTSDFSSHGSEASSFSDLSDASLSASALESGFLSNIGGNGSRL
ncbi:hypothetical protein CVT24_005786 [Panaeolus cyanescens]|uniref:Autophagy-related protein 29 n=1 Tax=Panaeolus cyanescens TaxID=181874 RepID=A0A409V933_9AGAR|nr:hypothetical protein CVT24_005786 [Panaeolus cyanescens]